MATNLDLSDITGSIENTLESSSLSQDDRSRLIVLKDWIFKKKSELRPWTEFFNTSRFAKPKNIGDVSSRVVGNLKIYQANYVIICVLLAFYCVITSPLLLFGLAMSCGGCYYISTRGQGQPVKLFGREFSVSEQYGLVFLISLPLFFLASAGSTVFWIIGASIFIIILHASLLSSKSTEIDLDMQGIEIK